MTGASGFIVAHIVEQLLAGGYSVRGTVRDAGNVKRYEYLTQLPGADRLELVAADLMIKGAFDSPVDSVEYVIHTASPYVLTVKDPQMDLVDPAVNGTLSVLRSCLASPSVKRVVLTSSTAAITDEPDGRTYTEADWNTTSSLSRNPYYYSKTMAERAAWRFMEEQSPHFDLIVINPSLVVGPEYSDSVNTSLSLFTGWTTLASPMILDLHVPIVDVRDVAASHIAAVQAPSAAGRYLCAADVWSWRQMIEWMGREIPDVRRPRIPADSAIGTSVMKVMSVVQPRGVRTYLKTHLGRNFVIDNTKVKQELGITFRPIEDTLRDTFADLIESGKIKS